jgi:hypothetical protein
VKAIYAGQQPRCMSLLWFQRNPLPTDWVAQREVVAGSIRNQDLRSLQSLDAGSHLMPATPRFFWLM